MRSQLRAKTLQLIEEHGPISSIDVAEQLGVTENHGRALVSHWKSLGCIYICSYVRSEEGRRLYPRALYRVGAGEDAAKPKALSKREYRRRHRAAKLARTSSVFGVAVPVDTRRVTSRKRPDVVKRHAEARAESLAHA